MNSLWAWQLNVIFTIKRELVNDINAMNATTTDKVTYTKQTPYVIKTRNNQHT